MNDCNKIVELLNSSEEIPKPKILLWMQLKDITAQGALYFLTNEKWDQIKPELTTDEICNFILKYLTTCIKENPPSADFIHTRYEAGWELSNWIKHLYAKGPQTHEWIFKIIHRLKNLYLEGSPEIQDCIVTATLEHIFEDKQLVKLFNDWPTDPKLNLAYEQALQWAQAIWNEAEG